MKNIILCGITGKMGKLIYECLGSDYNVIAGVASRKAIINDIFVYDDLNTCLKENKCDLIMDFTNPLMGLKHLIIALENNRFAIVIPNLMISSAFLV